MPSDLAAPPPAAPALSRRDRLRALLPSAVPYGIVLVLTLLITALTLQIRHYDLLAPLAYHGDGMLHLMLTKAFVENGWYLQNPSLGAPSGAELYEFPAADTLPGLFIKGFGLFTHEPALINNLFYLLTFPLTSLLAFAVCRQLGIRRGPAALASLLYAFLPYHFYRNTGHLYLTAYFLTPVAVLIAWWVATGRLFNAGEGSGGGGRRIALAAALCAVISLGGVYYPFFSGLMLGTGCLYALCVRRDWRSFLAGGLLGAVVAAGLLACLSPTLRYLHAHPHPPAAERKSGDAERYGLKVVQLVLPLDYHRLPALAALKEHYDHDSPLTNENTGATLGFVGASGFLLLVGWLLFRPVAGRLASAPAAPAAPAAGPPAPPFVHRELLDVFAVFNGVMVLYGTIGGFGSLFALLVSPQARGLNRISVFIAFLSLAALAACLDAWTRRWPATPLRRALGWGALALLLTLGVLDQTHPADLQYYQEQHHEYRADRVFFGQVERAVSTGAMIFQLPYMPFPESGNLNNLDDYAHFRGYVLTHGLRWSYGTIKEGHDDAWQRTVAGLPIAREVRLLAARGFGGILLERGGYTDDGVAVETELRRILGPPAAVRRLRLFFNLEGYARTLQASLTPEQWQQEQAAARHPILPVFQSGFTGQESDPDHAWRWSAQRSGLRLENDAAETRHVRLRMTVYTGRQEPAHLEMATPRDSRTWTIDLTRQPVAMSLDVPPGGLEIRFSCDGQPIDAPEDARVMVWNLTDLEVTEDLSAVK